MATLSPWRLWLRVHRWRVVLGLFALMAVAFVVEMKTRATQATRATEQAAQLKETQRQAFVAQAQKRIVQQHKGLSRNATQLALVAKVGDSIRNACDRKQYRCQFSFHLLTEPNVITLYALRSGDVYVTTALLNRMRTEGQLAAALAHGAAHTLVEDTLQWVGVEPYTKRDLWKYETDQEMKADTLAVALMANAGYDPNATIEMFRVLVDAYAQKAEVGFLTTHPSTVDRLSRVAEVIRARYPKGVPAELSR